MLSGAAAADFDAAWGRIARDWRRWLGGSWLFRMWRYRTRTPGTGLMHKNGLTGSHRARRRFEFGLSEIVYLGLFCRFGVTLRCGDSRGGLGGAQRASNMC